MPTTATAITKFKASFSQQSSAENAAIGNSRIQFSEKKTRD